MFNKSSHIRNSLLWPGLAAGILLTLSACGGGNSGDGDKENSPPTAGTDSISTPVNTAVNASFIASDPDNDTLMFSVIQAPSLGSLSITNRATGEFSYTPNPDIAGTDTVTFVANDGKSNSNLGVITLHILALLSANNDAYSVNEGDTLIASESSGVVVNDEISGSGNVTVSLVTAPVFASEFSLDADGSFTYQHDGSENFSDTFVYSIKNSVGSNSSATVTISITPLNDAPAAIDDTNNTTENTILDVPSAAGLLINDSDNENDNLFVSEFESTSMNGAIVSVNPDGSYTYNPTSAPAIQALANGALQVDTFSYTIGDGNGGFDSATVSIAVSGINDAPAANNDTAATDEDSILSVTANNGVLANDSDVENNPLTVTGFDITSTNGATVTVYSDGSFDYDPTSIPAIQTLNTGDSLPDSFSYTISDGNGGSDTGIVNITVSGTNDDPLADAGTDIFSRENTQIFLSGTGNDIDGTIVSYLWEQIDSTGIDVTINNAETSNANFSVDVTSQTSFQFRLTVTDDNGATDVDTVNVTVSNVFLTEDFNSGLANWSVVDDVPTASSWTIANSELIQQIRVESINSYVESYHKGTYIYYTPGLSLTDYRLDVEARFIGEKLADDIGVMFRYTDNNNYYRLSLNSRYGFTRLEKKVGGVFFPIKTNARGYSIGQTINISINLYGPAMQIFVDGEPLFALTDNSLPTGTVALYTQDKSIFDNVIIQSVTAQPTVVINTPASHSVQTSSTITASAIASNVPVNGAVEFLLNGANSVIDSTPPYTASYSDVPPGNHTVDAIIRDAESVELARDTNINVGTQGDVVIAVGDSITNGTGDSYASDNLSQDGRIIANQGFTTNLHDALNAVQSFPGIVLNEGIGGDESVDASDLRITSILQRNSNANRALVLLGTNDATAQIPSGLGCSGASCNGTYKGNMQSLVNQINAAGLDTRVALLPPIFGNGGVPFADPATAGRNTNYIERYNSVVLNELSNRQVGPDLYGYFLGSGTNRFSLFYDTLHPNSLGYAVIAQMWLNSLTNTNYPLPFVLDNVIPSTTSPYFKQNILEVGDKYYIDQDYTLTSIPNELAEGRWLMTTNGGKFNTSTNYVSFSVDRPVTVYIAYDAGATTPPDWMSGFTDTGLSLLTSDPLSPTLTLFSQTFSSGPITLGGNLQGAASGANSNYVPIVVENQ